MQSGSRRPRKSHAPGVCLAYDVAVGKLADQFKLVDQHNTRLGVTLVAAVAVGGLDVQNSLPGPERLLAAVLLVMAGAAGFAAARIGKWSDAPDPEGFAGLAGDDPSFMKATALPAVLDALRTNRPKLRRKGRYIVLTLVSVTAALMVVIVGKTWQAVA